MLNDHWECIDFCKELGNRNWFHMAEKKKLDMRQWIVVVSR